MNRLKYDVMIIFFLLLMVIFMGYFFYQVFPKNKLNFSFFNNKEKTDIYIINSNTNNDYFLDIGILDNYKDNIIKLQNKFLTANIKSKIINIEDIKNIPENSIIILPDIISISKKEFNIIKQFLANGGNIIFNYHFGYMDNNKLVKAKRIEEITKLKYIKEGISKKNSPFLVPKVLSPFILSSTKAHRIDSALYGGDIIPVFRSSKIPDFVYTNWAITSTLMDLDTNKLLDFYEDGAVWHGKYMKGNWLYFNFPLYVLLDLNNNDFNFILNNIINYFKNPITVSIYPYIDYKKAVFISEDTEYEYPYGLNFATLANKYDINVTMFCVAKLAEEYPEITKKESKFSNVEIGSHSYSHTKIVGTTLEKYKQETIGSKQILEKIINKKIYGFRPPREEIDKTMINLLIKGGYKYVMEKEKPYLLPKEEYKGIVTIPRHGTDDYLYLVQLDWDKTKILKRIIYETDFLTKINTIYTLSVHTHLLSYKSNIAIEKAYFDYLKTKKDIMPLKGMDLIKRYYWKKNIHISTAFYNNKAVININNKNKISIKNLKIRIYTPDIKIKSIVTEIVNSKIKIIKKTKEYMDVEISEINPLSNIAIFVYY
ncbi:polysaccharide deacetylase family protein [Lebetimonas natsushimae]|uniref:polysaccharide deacetylase family protein n=1 Tax=Lebetimonas natsushimae TaxID=1936991 RepID=UPI0015548CF3|nr:polysaccharide deacetylase family protein [Lebetimonas natsushimae]